MYQSANQQTIACEGGDLLSDRRMTEHYQGLKMLIGAASDVVRPGLGGCMEVVILVNQSVDERQLRRELESGIRCLGVSAWCGLRPRPCCKTRCKAAHEPDDSRLAWSLRDRMAVKQHTAAARSLKLAIGSLLRAGKTTPFRVLNG